MNPGIVAAGRAERAAPASEDRHVNVIRHLTALRSKGYSVRAYVMTIVTIALIPVLMFGGWPVYTSAHSQREQAQHGNQANRADRFGTHEPSVRSAASRHPA